MDVAPDIFATGFPTRSNAGLLLLDGQNCVVYYNAHAKSILTYADAGATASMHQVIRSLLQPLNFSQRAAALPFMSGRRRYTCRWFVLAHTSGNPEHAGTGVLLERTPPNRVDVSAVAQQFGLTQREQQTVELLTLGLTSKEIASRMNISPNTVKAFFRLVMTKMSVNTRSGIVGKVAQLQATS